MPIILLHYGFTTSFTNPAAWTIMGPFRTSNLNVRKILTKFFFVQEEGTEIDAAQATKESEL